MKKGCLLLILLLVGGLTYGGYAYWQKSRKPPEWTLEKARKGRIRKTISASGSLAALITVDVGTQISGIIASIAVDFNDRVYAGQLIAQIDSSTYEAQLQQAVANLENAKATERNNAAQIQNLKAGILSLKAEKSVQAANVRKAEVALEDSRRDFRRIKELHARKLVSEADLDKAESAMNSQLANVDATKAQLQAVAAKGVALDAQISAAEAQREGALARVRQMEAQLNVSKINLERTLIYSPIDGVVISRNVDAGQTVAASLQAPTLFSIAKDLTEMQIDTAVDEADIGQIREGQRVTFTVDAYKEQSFRGTVHQVRLSPQVTSNVVTYSVIVNVRNPDLLLKPGMTANVEILTDERRGVLTVPARAVFYSPPEAFQTGVAAGQENGEDVATDAARVWVEAGNGKFRPVDVRIGLSDDRRTEITGGDLPPDAMVLTGANGAPGGAGRRDRSSMRNMRRVSRRM